MISLVKHFSSVLTLNEESYIAFIFYIQTHNNLVEKMEAIMAIVCD